MKNTNYLAATIALIVLISISLIAPDAEAQRRRAVDRHSDLGNISGVVTDAADGEPIAGAVVSIGDSLRTTNSEGEYRFANLTPGSFTITADHWGYEPTTRTVTVTSGDNTADFSLTISPWVTLTRTNGAIERYGADTVEFGYTIVFAGTFSSPTLTVCTGNPAEPREIDRGSIARIQGPAVRVNTSCCPKFPGEQVRIQMKSGEAFDAVIRDSCAPYDMYFIGRNLESQTVIYRRMSEVSLIQFPE